MDKETEENRLVNSLKSLHYLCDYSQNIGTGENFMEIYNDVLHRISQRAESTSSNYMKEKLDEFPQFSAKEVDVYLDRDKDGAITRLAPIAGIVKGLWNTVKSKGANLSNINDKFRATSSICKNVLQVIEQPALEEMINQSKK
ncbi:hypothetical protein [Parvicella tangerina]|uniref:Uncharacterized protein n=1 Tax=Parvicella tangerina TaxID=2829795 RepID=A0A916JJ93_9FLAO|nr:hypothetical protein [Parvicella tangerina]CAG5076649.1 hypothetical protein CRYO30217_00161 [Parvicella tangerina]